MPFLHVLAVVFSLVLNEPIIALSEVKSTIEPLSLTAGSYLQYSHKIPDFFE